MAHNFVSGTKAQFGWEMIGWSLGVKVTQKVANKPVFQRQVQDTRKTRRRPSRSYRALRLHLPARHRAQPLRPHPRTPALASASSAYGPKLLARLLPRRSAPARGALDDAVHQDGRRQHPQRGATASR